MKTDIFKAIKKQFKRRSPEILLGISIAGYGSAVIFAAKATPKALKILEGLDEKARESRWTVFKKAAPCYIPAAVMFAGATACAIGANSVHVRRNAALAAACTLSENALKEYTEKVVQEIGKNKEQKIRDKIAADKVQNNPVESREVIITGNGDSLCYESISGRYFETSIDKLQKAANELNHRMLYDMFVSLNDVYEAVGLPVLGDSGDDLGWNVDKGLIEFDFSSQLASDGRPCLVLQYRNPPQHNYQFFG